MRIAGLALALAACAQLTLLSSPAFAQDSSVSAGASVSASTSTSSSSATAPTSAPAAASDSSDAAPPSKKDKEKTGWIILGVGGAVGVAGIVIDIVGTQVASDVPGQTGTKTNTTRTDLYWGGTTMIVAGVLAGIYGGSMILDARKPDVQPSQTPRDRSQDDASAEKAMQARLTSAPQVQLPILSAKF